eukprot:480445_1
MSESSEDTKSGHCHQCYSYSLSLYEFYPKSDDTYCIFIPPGDTIEYLCKNCSFKNCVECDQKLPRFGYKFCEICNAPICYNKTDMVKEGVTAFTGIKLCDAKNHSCSNIDGLTSAIKYLQSIIMNQKHINNIRLNPDLYNVISYPIGLVKYYDMLFSTTNTLLCSAISWEIFKRHCHKLYQTPINQWNTLFTKQLIIKINEMIAVICEDLEWLNLKRDYYIFQLMGSVDIKRSYYDKPFFMAVAFFNFNVRAIFCSYSMIKYVISHRKTFKLVSTLISNIFKYFDYISRKGQTENFQFYKIAFSHFLSALVIPLISMLDIENNKIHRKFNTQMLKLRFVKQYMVNTNVNIKYIGRVKTEQKLKMKCNYKYCNVKNSINSEKLWKFKFCSTCKIAFYCSRRCQKKDWNKGNHRYCCSLLNYELICTII